MTDAIRELFELLTKKEKSGSDYTGTVTRVDGKTAYVQFDGSDITDTPVALSIGAKAGDSVRVRVADGRAWLVGNDDAPPNDSSEVGYELALTNALIRQLTTEQINGENGWINLLQGTFNYGNGALQWNGRELSLNGKVIAKSGEIGQWSISDNGLTHPDGSFITPVGIMLIDPDVSWAVVTPEQTTILKYPGSQYSQMDADGIRTSGDISGGTVQVGDSQNQTFIGEGTGDFTGAVSAKTFTENGTSLVNKYMGIQSANGFYGMIAAGANNVWIRTTTLGLIPYQSGGSGSLGTSSWPFAFVHATTIYEGGTALSSKYAPINLNYVRDSANNNANITFSYASAGMNYADYTWLAAWNGYQLRAVHKSQFLASTGGTLSGALTVSSGSIIASNGHVCSRHATDAYAYAQNTTTTCYAAMRSHSNGLHGLYSNGYWNQSAFVSSVSWFCYRGYEGNWYIADKTTVNGSLSVKGALKGYNEGYSTLRPVVGTNAGTNAVGVIVSNTASFGIYGRWAGGASANMSGRTISCPSSDIRLKKNIKDSEADALSVINAIRMRQFDWKDKSRGHWDCGMIVDEMERDIDPNFCIGGEDTKDGTVSYKSVDTFYLQGYEVKAIQELHAEVKSLKAEIAELKEIIAVLMEGKK